MIGFQQRDNAPEEPCRPFRLIPAIIANRDSALQSVLFCIHSSNSPTGWAALLPMDLQDDKNKKKKKSWQVLLITGQKFTDGQFILTSSRSPPSSRSSRLVNVSVEPSCWMNASSPRPLNDDNRASPCICRDLSLLHRVRQKSHFGRMHFQYRDMTADGGSGARCSAFLQMQARAGTA